MLQQDCFYASERDDFRIIHVTAVIHSESKSNISALPNLVFPFVLAHLVLFGATEILHINSNRLFLPDISKKGSKEHNNNK